MSKKYWQENLILLFVIIIMVAGFLFVKNYLAEVFSNKIEEIGISQSKKMNENIKKMTESSFDFSLFNQEQYKNLNEYIVWPPEEINNQGNPEPFKEIGCPSGACTAECPSGACPLD